MSLSDFLLHSDAVSRLLALVLLSLSVGSWVVIFWKTWLLQRAAHDVARCTTAFWQASDTDAAVAVLKAFDRNTLVLPLVQAAQKQLQVQRAGLGLAAAGDAASQLTRVLRDALQLSLHKLQSGQVLLATVGAVAPFALPALVARLEQAVIRMWAAGVSHGDLHAWNVLVRPNGELVLLDMGFAVCPGQRRRTRMREALAAILKACSGGLPAALHRAHARVWHVRVSDVLSRRGFATHNPDYRLMGALWRLCAPGHLLRARLRMRRRLMACLDWLAVRRPQHEQDAVPRAADATRRGAYRLLRVRPCQ